MNQETDRPRRQHYYFAHRYLQERAFKHPELLIKDLLDKSAGDYLKILWATVGLSVIEKDEGFISSQDLESFPVEIGGDYHGVVIQFPKPERMSEAFFAAILLPNSISADESKSSACEFYTLEFNPDRENQTYLARWIEGNHFNLGEATMPEKEAFLKVVTKILRNRE